MILTARPDQLAELGVELGQELWSHTPAASTASATAKTFADVAPGGLLLYQDGLRMLALAVNVARSARPAGRRARR